MSVGGRIGERTLVLTALVALAVVLSGCSVLAAPSADIQFEEATASAGLNYTDDPGASVGKGNAGVYVLDANGDGWQDLLTIGDAQPALWYNDRGQFVRSNALPDVDRTIKSASVTDYDGDGSVDLLLLAPDAKPVALHNDGGKFSRDDVGIGNLTYPLGAAAADYDGDGDEDLLVYQSGDWGNSKPTGYNTFYDNIEEDNGNPNYVYENVGGEYERRTAVGLSGERWSLAASFVDLTGDQRPDIHVANDYNSDVVYVNQGDGTFERHVLGNATARNGMSSEIGDFDRDGRPDVFVTNVEIPVDRDEMSQARYERIAQLQSFVIKSERTSGNNLLVNQGNASFSDEAEEFGVRVGGWGWAASHADLNNDGDRDLLQATENVFRVDPDDPVYTYPMLFEREGGEFERLDADQRGLAEDNGRGLVTLDYDHDGALEAVSANYASQFTVYDNDLPESANSLQFQVVDADGTTAFGARVRVHSGPEVKTYRQHSRTDFLSSGGRYRHVGLGGTESVDLTVTWPDGTERTFEDVPADRIVRLTPDGVETVAITDA